MKPFGAYVHEPDPENPGWHSWVPRDPARFAGQTIGRMLVRREGETAARLRMFPAVRHSNGRDQVHGGAMLGLIDIALFATIHTVLDADSSASTLDADCRFLGPARLDDPLDAVTEVLRETGRLVFLRGLIEQDGITVASYSGTVRKA